MGNYFREDMAIIEKISALKLELPPPPQAAGLYKSVLVQDRLALFSGHLPICNDGTMITGKVGVDLSMEEAIVAARQVGFKYISQFTVCVGRFGPN